MAELVDSQSLAGLNSDESLSELAEAIRICVSLAPRFAELDNIHEEVVGTLRTINERSARITEESQTRLREIETRVTEAEARSQSVQAKLDSVQAQLESTARLLQGEQARRGELEAQIARLREAGSTSNAGPTRGVRGGGTDRTVRADAISAPSEELVGEAVSTFAASGGGLMRGTQIVSFFQEYEPSIPDHPGSGAPSRWELFTRGLRSLDPASQWAALDDLCRRFDGMPGVEGVAALMRTEMPEAS